MTVSAAGEEQLLRGGADVDCVPETIDAQFEPPIPPRRLPLWRALPALWLLPARTGPHLAAGPWPRAEPRDG